MEIRQVQKNDIDVNEILDLTQNSIMSKIFCHNIGKIVAFNSEYQTVDVELQQIKQYKGEYLQPSLLTDVPLYIYATNSAWITLPNLVGCTCIILSMDRNIDAYINTEETYVPITNRLHDITDSIALVTFKTQVNKIENYDTNALTIQHKKDTFQAYIKNFANAIDTKVWDASQNSEIIQTASSLSSNITDGSTTTTITQNLEKVETTVTGEETSTITQTEDTITIDSKDIENTADNDIELTADNNIELTADKDIELTATQNITIKATNTMELNALNKVKITNTVETLGLILSDLIQVITGLRTVGNDTLNNDTQNALNAVKARVISLLE